MTIKQVLEALLLGVLFSAPVWMQIIFELIGD